MTVPAMTEEARSQPRYRSLLTLLAALASTVAICVALCFFVYPGLTVLGLAADDGARATGQPTDFAASFRATAGRYRVWAQGYLEDRRGESVSSADVAGTEWPLFATVFFLVSAEQLVKEGKLVVDDDLGATVALAAEVVVHPSTASWVRRKWGEDYLSRENVFYRMLVILGLTSFEAISRDPKYHELQQSQARALGAELHVAKYHLADDYPEECYPNDVLWAAVAIRRALGDEADGLSREVMGVLDGVAKGEQGLPAFKVDAKTAEIQQSARGSNNSGMLSFAGELDANIASRWYAAYTEHYWQDGLVRGFRESPKGWPSVMDVDSGPVILGMGSVASAFGIGAARANGRYDHAATLSLQVLAASWPTPFGPLVPGVMGFLAADGWCFGELALSFALTRPSYVSAATSNGSVSIPPLVWLLSGFYLGMGVLILVRETLYWRRRLRASRSAVSHS